MAVPLTPQAGAARFAEITPLLSETVQKRRRRGSSRQQEAEITKEQAGSKVGEPSSSAAPNGTFDAASEWEELRSCWAGQRQKQALLPYAPRLRQFVVPGKKALIKPAESDDKWYRQRAKASRAREEAERCETEIKRLVKQKAAETAKKTAGKKLAAAKAEADELEKALKTHTNSEHGVPKAELLAFGEGCLRSAGLALHDPCADRAFRYILALVLDVSPSLPALTPVSVSEALCAIYKASLADSKAFYELLSPERTDFLQEMGNVVLHRDQTISEPCDMFMDMAQALPKELIKPLLGVAAVEYATMCSGTESPIMALDLFSKACDEIHGKPLNFKHNFSCEIDPVKQGYIYRNFGVPTLFRDIQELGGKKAHTAWNSEEDVPGADAAVAGTSCVDFSSLNTQRKALDEKGESGDTFDGLLAWVKQKRPTLVVNENVMAHGAKNPWPEMQRRMEDLGYAARYRTFDSKNYYVPQTRQRRYMVAINCGKDGVVLEDGTKLTAKMAQKVLDDWDEMVEALGRRYTATLEHYLYRDDDPAVARSRNSQQREKSNCGSKDSDWTRCLMRHITIREEQQLGDRRPMVHWDESGAIHPSDDADWKWWAQHTGRVKDVAEVCFMRCVAAGQDPRYKPIYMNLSQNPERNDSSRVQPGLCPCLTPCEIPLISSRGGSIIAQERLKLQTLPVDSLTFTRETEKDLSSLAGNAMTATVVGAVMFAAWTALVKAGYRREPAPKSRTGNLPAWGYAPTPRSLPAPFPLGRGDLAELCEMAVQSSALCPSELGFELKGGIAACKNCGHSASVGVRGYPCGVENFKLPVHPRSSPSEFHKRLVKILPPCVRMEGLDAKKLLAAAAPANGIVVERWAECCAAAASADGLVLYSIDRCRYHWRITWRDPSQKVGRGGLRLELLLGADGAQVGSDHLCEWRFFADVEKCGMPQLRPLLQRHFAKLNPSGSSLLQGAWEVRLPESPQVALTIKGKHLGPSWERTLGIGFDIKREAAMSANAWNELHVRAAPGSGLEAVEGVYVRYHECGAANGSLHIRKSGGEKMYLFREADPVTYAEGDYFVIAQTFEKLPPGVQREHIAVLPKAWRPLPEQGEQYSVTATRPGRWQSVAISSVKLRLPARDAAAVVQMPGALNSEAKASEGQLIARIEVPLAPEHAPGQIWAKATNVSERGREGVASLLRYLRPAAAAATEPLAKWQELPAEKVGQRLANGLAADEKVAPKYPSVQWVPHPKAVTKLIPQECSEEASNFERILRTAPKALEVVTHPTDAGGELLIAARPQVVALQAASALSAEVLDGTDQSELKLAFRVQPKDAAPPLMPDSIWVSGAAEAEKMRLFGRFNRCSVANGVEYVREACDAARFVRAADGVWQLLDRNGKVAFASDGSQGAGVLPHQVQGWTLRGKLHTSLLVEAKSSKSFELPGNDADKAEGAVPPGWNPELPLWPMQQKSVGWLKAQEVKSKVYLQEAVEHFDVPSLGLRIEGRATMPTHGHRAVLADGVGFGKTAVVLARLCDPKTPVPERGEWSDCGRLLSRATLVMVPPHLVGQWLAETDKFITGRKVKTLRIDSAKDLADTTVGEILDAELIVANFEVLGNSKYLNRLSDCATAGARHLVSMKGRYQIDMYREVLDHLHRLGQEAGCAKKGGEVAAMEVSRRESYAECQEAVAARNITRKGMNAQRKRRRMGEEVTLNNVPVRGVSARKLKGLFDGETDVEALVNLPLEMFQFQRVVCDEVSFVHGHMATALSEGLRGRSHLCLTGTPGLENVKSVSKLARSVGMILGPDEMHPEERGQAKGEELTTAESFRHYTKVPDETRYQQQSEQASEWLQRFARHNEPQRDHIKMKSETCSVMLSAAEMVLYLEKEQQLKSLTLADFQMKGSKGAAGSSLRDQRMKAMMRGEELKSLQEVLLYEASFPEGQGTSAEAVLANFRKEREAQLKAATNEFREKVRDLEHRYKELIRLEGGEGLSRSFPAWKKRIEEAGVDVDVDIRDDILKIIKCAEKNPKRNNSLWAKEKGTKRPREEDDEEACGNKVDELQLCLKEGLNTSSGVHKLLQELSRRTASLRFFDAVSRCLLRPKQKVEDDADGKMCQPCDVVVLPCGHKGRLSNFEPKLKGEGRCCVEGCCEENILIDQLLVMQKLLDDRKSADSTLVTGPYGSKLAHITGRLNKVLQEDATNRVLVFCQLPCLMSKLRDVLKQQRIAFEDLQGTPKDQDEAMDRFKVAQGKSPRVLLVNLDDAQCSGANLTSANYVFFAHPVMKAGSRSAADIEAQAVGRARRFGQTRTVQVVRFVATSTVEATLEASNCTNRKN